MFMKTITLATFATGAMARSLKQEDPDRLLLAVQKPAIEANSATVESEVTVSWRTGPSATTSSYTVSCFSGDQWTCATYPDAGQGFTASGELEKAALPSTVDETFTFAGAVEGDVVQCFIEVEGEFGYAAKCIGLETAFVGTKPAGAPTNVVPDAGESGEISFTWTDGTSGSPEETYTISCTENLSVTDCLSTTDTDQVTGIVRGTEAGTLTGLTDGDDYKCWVIAVNSVDSVCSDPVQYTLPLAPGAPTDVSLGSTTSGEISFTWTDGTPGVPVETYTISCTENLEVTDCLSTTDTDQVTGITRGTQAGTLTGLTDGTEYKCWVIAVNSVDSVCSDPVQYTLPLAPGAPTDVSLGSTTSGEISFTWTDGTPGVPVETYTISCTENLEVTDCLSTTDTDQVTGITRGTQAGTLTGLTDGTDYKCWVIAVNSVDSVCSDFFSYNWV